MGKRTLIPIPSLERNNFNIHSGFSNIKYIRKNELPVHLSRIMGELITKAFYQTETKSFELPVDENSIDCTFLPPTLDESLRDSLFDSTKVS